MNLIDIILIVSVIWLVIYYGYGYRKRKKLESMYCPPPKAISRHKCGKCGYTKELLFKRFEYVLQKTKHRCPKCGTAMFIDAIYVKYGKSIVQLKQEAELEKWTV